MANLNFIEEIKAVKDRIRVKEELIGKGLMMPNNATNSGSRKIMYSTQIEHTLPLLRPEPPVLGTGYENRFGEFTSSFHKADADYKILAKIPKFDYIPEHHYYLIVENLETGIHDIIERVSYEHITESYGFLYNTDYLDSKKVGDIISKGDTYLKSLAYDEYDNRQDGVNLITTYLSCEYTKEDGMIISIPAAIKLAAPLLKKVQVIINDNDISLNIYGGDELYKSFPNVKEHVTDGILCALRREKKEEALFTQAVSKLQEIILSDDTFCVQGEVIDINIFCNNPEMLESSTYCSQIKYYYDQHINTTRQLVGLVGSIKASGKKCSYDMDKMNYNAKRLLDGVQYIKDNKPFSNVIIEFIILEESLVSIGDKISNRYGGKGVVSLILPEDQMPQLENGQYVECIFNSSTCVNRENVGQLIEASLTHTGSKLIDYLKMNVLSTEEAIEMYLKYLDTIAPEQSREIMHYIGGLNSEEQKQLVDCIINSDVMISLQPLSDSLGVDDINRIYQTFPHMGQYKIKVPQKDSNGNVRFIETRRKLVVGKQYIYRLKQYAEEKFSAVSLSATNVKNENSRNSSKKTYKSIHAKTPIRFGEMETGDMIHMGAENVIINLMLHSVSPHGRRLAEELLTGDPFDINIQLDDMAKNRSVEILNAYLLTMGLELNFKKIPKKKQPIFRQKIIKFIDNPGRDNTGLKPIIWKVSPNEVVDPNYINEFKDPNSVPFLRKIIEYYK